MRYVVVDGGRHQHLLAGGDQFREALAAAGVELGEDVVEDERVLVVRCDSTAWATNLRLLAPTLVARLNEDLGHGAVKMIKVNGPAGPARRYGPLRAPGSTGPGDTYG